MSDLTEFKPLVLIGPLVRRWYWLAVCAIVGAAISTVSVILDPPRFESFAILLPSRTQGGGGDLFTLAARLGIGGGGGGGDISGIYGDVIHSIRFSDRFADYKYPKGKGKKFALTTLEKEYELPPSSDTVNHPYGLNSVFAGPNGLAWKILPNGTVRLSFQAEDAVLASAVVERVMDELQQYTMEVRSSGTTQKLQVTVRNMDSVSKELTAAENQLVAFQNANFVLSPAQKAQFTRLEREVSVLSGVYVSLRQSRAALEVERDSYLPTFQVIESPRPAPVPTFKPLKKWMPIGIFLGGFFGLFVAVLIAWIKKEFQGILVGAGL